MRKWMICLVLVALAGGATIPLEALASPSQKVIVMQTQTRAKVAVIQQQVRSQVALPRPVAVQKPVVAASAAPVAVAPPVPTGSVQDRIRAAWPGDDAKVLRVISCETGGTFNPDIRSRTGKFWGLFQADPSFRATYGYGSGSVEDQVAMGWRGYQARGWSPWPVCGKR